MSLFCLIFFFSGPGPAQNETTDEFNLGLEYNKYLQEVVSILESDQEFKKKLENAKVLLYTKFKALSYTYILQYFMRDFLFLSFF